MLLSSGRDTGDNGGRASEPAEASRGTCNTIVALAFLQLLAVAKRARRGTVIGDATTNIDASQDVTEKFGPLKVVLGSIPAIYANSQVRYRSLLKTLLNEHIYRDPSPSETRSKTSSSV